MTLFFDQNISFRIVRILSNDFPDCNQVNQTELSNATDIEIWKYAKTNDRCIVTFDSDFLDILTLKGFPPKIILLRFGNRSTQELASILADKKDIILRFLDDSEIGALEIHV